MEKLKDIAKDIESVVVSSNLDEEGRKTIENALSRLRAADRLTVLHIDPQDELYVYNSTVFEKQIELANEWQEKEPELKYFNEWSHSEAFHEFQEYVVGSLSRLIADRVCKELVKPALDKRYNDLIKNNTTFKNYQDLYNETK